MQNTILVIEDDADISEMLLALLSANNLQGKAAYSGSEALLLLESEHYDCLLLDLMLPGVSGLEVLRRLRASGDLTPVIVLTAETNRGTVADLLTAGANDYMTKPFDTRELLARIEVQLRMRGGQGAKNAGTGPDGHSQASMSTEEGISDIGTVPAASTTNYRNLVCDSTIYDALVDGRPAHLSKTEFALFQLLMSDPQRVFTKDVIFAQIWGGEYLGDNTINVHISKLRAKLAAIDPDTEHIATVWGIGFKMAE